MYPLSINSAKGTFAPLSASADFFKGLSKFSLWTAFAWDEIQQRYRRSKLGLAWIVFSYLLFVVAIAVFFGGFSSLNGKEFTIYVAMNYSIFLFLLANLVDGCEVFKVASSWIKSTPIPHSVYIYKSISRSLFTFVINVTVACIVCLFLGWQPTETAWIAVPAFGLLLLNAIWMQSVFGYLAARYRDLGHLIAALSRVLFFTTPVLWVRDERTGMVATIADFNPFTHALEIFSTPLLGGIPRTESWIVIGTLTIIGFILAIVVGGLSRKKLAFWL